MQGNYYGQYYAGEYNKPLFKWYNPNKFNIFHSGAGFAIASLFFVFLYFFGGYLIPSADDIYLENIISTVIIQGVIFLIAFFIAKAAGVGLLNGGGYRVSGLKAKDAVFSLFLILGVIFTFTFIADLFVEGIGISDAFDVSSEEATGSIFFMVIYLTIFVTIPPAICEEFLMRGVVLRGLEGIGKLPAVLISAFAFMLLHRSPVQTILQFLGGLAIGLVMVKTRNIIYPMIMHFFNNLFAISVSFVYFMLENSSDAANIAVKALSIAAGVVFLLLGLYHYLLPDKWKFFKKRETVNEDELFIKKGYSGKEEFLKEKESSKGNYYYAAQEPDEFGNYLPKTEEWNEELKLDDRKASYSKYFYTNSGWKKLKRNNGKVLGILMLLVGVGVCVLFWIIQYNNLTGI